jgi:hypothetical protein
MQSQAPRQTGRQASQLQLLPTNDRLASLSAKDRALLVRLLARLLREAVQRTEKEVTDDDA